MEINFFEGNDFYSMLFDDADKNKLDEKTRRICIDKVLKRSDMRYLIKTLNDYNLDLKDEDYEYIKKFFLKYRMADALWLKSIKPQLFLDKDNEYLLCCSLENYNIAKSRLSYNFEDDNADVINLIIERHLVNFSDLLEMSRIKNDILQDCLLEKFRPRFHEIKSKIILFDFGSKIFKELFIECINDQSFVNKFILEEHFLDKNLGINEKMLFHDLYYEKIWTQYIKSSEKKKQNYVDAYGKLLFESEMLNDINSYYKNNNIDRINAARNLYYFTKNMLEKDNAFEVKRKIIKA